MILNKIPIKNDYIQNLICFLALRLFPMIKTKRSRIKNGDLLLLSSFGAGFTWGSILIKWKSYD